MNSVKRWVYIINILRALPEVDLSNQCINVEDVRLHIRYGFESDGDYFTYVTNMKTNELCIKFSEDGYPTYMNEWAKGSVQWDMDDFPMCEPDIDTERDIYHWHDENTGEIRHNIWNVIFGDIADAWWMIRHRYKIIRRKWRYSKKGW